MTGRLPEMHLFDFLHVDRRFSTQLLMTRDSRSGVPDSSINRFGTIVLKLTVPSELSKRQLRVCKHITSRFGRAQQAAPLQMRGSLFFYSPLASTRQGGLRPPRCRDGVTPRAGRSTSYSSVAFWRRSVCLMATPSPRGYGQAGTSARIDSVQTVNSFEL